MPSPKTLIELKVVFLVNHHHAEFTITAPIEVTGKENGAVYQK